MHLPFDDSRCRPPGIGGLVVSCARSSIPLTIGRTFGGVFRGTGTVAADRHPFLFGARKALGKDDVTQRSRRRFGVKMTYSVIVKQLQNPADFELAFGKSGLKSVFLPFRDAFSKSGFGRASSDRPLFLDK
jgi:hypothetical protein